MDEETKALNAEAEEINSRVNSPITEEKASEEVVETESTEEVEATETEERKGAQARIRELNQEKKKAQEEARSLKEKLAELTGVNQGSEYLPKGNEQTFDPQEPIVTDGEELSAAELNKRIAQRDQKLLQQMEARSELRFKQNEAVTRINSEASEVIRDYPMLNPDSEEFNQDLSDAITEATEAYVSKNPYSASVKTFVGRLMKPYLGAVSTEVGKASVEIAKQASQAALRPTSVRKAEKTAKEKSIAELEKDLGIVQV